MSFPVLLQGWGDVYFFCGPEHEYCTCSFRWNLLGWWKAATLWNFSIATAVGLQKLALQLGLGGLLPGVDFSRMLQWSQIFTRGADAHFNSESVQPQDQKRAPSLALGYTSVFVPTGQYLLILGDPCK